MCHDPNEDQKLTTKVNFYMHTCDLHDFILDIIEIQRQGIESIGAN